MGGGPFGYKSGGGTPTEYRYPGSYAAGPLAFFGGDGSVKTLSILYCYALLAGAIVQQLTPIGSNELNILAVTPAGKCCTGPGGTNGVEAAFNLPLGGADTIVIGALVA